MTGIAKLVALCVLVLAMAAAPARAEKQVIFAPLTGGPDFDEAMEFFAEYFKDEPDTYTSKVSVEEPGDARALRKSLGIYLRKVVHLGKGDVNDDGIEEIFYFLRGSDPFTWCGSAGCMMLIVQRKPSGLKLLCETYSGEGGLWITNRITVRGYRELRASYRVYWHGDQCDSEVPEVRDIPGRLEPDPLRAPGK